MKPSQPYVIPKRVVERPGPRPMVGVCLAFLCGVVYARYFPAPLMPLIVSLFAMVVLWFGLTQNFLRERLKPLHWVMVLCLSAMVGAARMESLFIEQENLHWQSGVAARQGEQRLRGTVEEIRPRVSGASMMLSDVEVEHSQQVKPFAGNIEIYSGTSQLAILKPGDRIEFECAIEPVRGPALPTAFDYQQIRFTQGIFATGYLRPNQKIERIEQADSVVRHAVRGWAYDGVARIRNLFEGVSATRLDDHVGLLSSICFGLRGNVTPELNDALALSGLAHITAISGLHVSIVLYFLFFALKWLGLRRKHSAWLTSVIAVFYVMLVGARVPILRSVLMAYVLLGKHFVQRRVEPLNSLALAALVLLLIDPSELFLPSFQFSFIAVFVLILVAPLNERLKRHIRPLYLSVALRGLLTSCAVTLAVAPLSIYYFHIFSWGSIIANLAAVPLVTFYLPVMYLTMAVSFVPVDLLQAVMTQAALFLSKLLLMTVYFFAERPVFWRIVPAYNPAFAVLGGLSVLFLVQPKRVLFEKRRIAVYGYQVSLVLLSGCLLVHLVAPFFQPLRIDFVALGQGDCSFIRTPSGKTVLIDGGAPLRGDYPYRFTPLVNYLLSQGVDSIDVMVVTHPQADHIGDFRSVVELFPIGVLLEGKEDFNSKAYNALVADLDERGVKREKVRSGDCIQLDSDSRFWVLNPNEETGSRKTDVNEESVVLLFEHEELRVLFTGDIGFPAEKELCARLEGWDVDVMKVPHHGSRFSSSSEFVNETLPEYAVFPVGRNNYGHPHPDSMNRYQAVHAHLLRTDLDGTVRLQSNGDGFQLYTTRSNRIFQQVN